MSIQYIRGDATKPIGLGNKLLVHICNDIGAWGAGFTKAVSNRWREPEMNYRGSFGSSSTKPVLGVIQKIQVEKELWVVNMIAQHGVKNYTSYGLPPIRYEAVGNCLIKVEEIAREMNAKVHMPRIGCGLAGGDWGIIGEIIQNTLIDKGIEVLVYDLR